MAELSNQSAKSSARPKWSPRLQQSWNLQMGRHFAAYSSGGAVILSRDNLPKNTEWFTIHFRCCTGVPPAALGSEIPRPQPCMHEVGKCNSANCFVLSTIPTISAKNVRVVRLLPQPTTLPFALFGHGPRLMEWQMNASLLADSKLEVGIPPKRARVETVAACPKQQFECPLQRQQMNAALLVKSEHHHFSS